MADTQPKSFQPLNKDIRYLNRDFASFKSGLFEFSKNYFPKTYKDFSESSPGTMFIEQAAYVGDVLSYYIDYQFKESLMPYSEERKNVIALAKYLGYKTTPTKSSITEIELFQLIPSKVDSDGNYVPDEKYCLSIRENMELLNNSDQNFIISEPLDFSVDTRFSPREVSVYSRDSLGVPQFFLLRKTAKAFAGKIVTKNFTVGAATPYYKIVLEEKNVVNIITVVDEDNNKWYEADYLAQDVVFTDIDNSQVTDENFFVYKSEVSKIIKSLKTSRKYVTSITADNTTYLEFGPGLDNYSDEIVYPNASIIGIGLSNIRNTDISLDGSNFLKTNTFGASPANTVLTINYIIGGGSLSNCNANEITRISSYQLLNDATSLNPDEQTLFNTVKQTLRVNNYTSAVGGADEESVDQIKQNAILNFTSQNRSVTKDDYLIRTYAMPPKYGSVAKAYITSDTDLILNLKNDVSGFVDYDNNTTSTNNSVDNYFRKINYDVTNPFSVNLYVLGYNENKNLTQINEALFYNVKEYLKKYRLLTDGVNIIDGYIINIGVNFKILTYNNYNKKEVLNNCILKVKDFFNIDKWSFSQPINLSQLELEIARVEGVQSLTNVEIVNLTSKDGNYSPHEYDILSATKNKIIYPSLDPCVFEVKYTDIDIKGNVV